MSLQFLVGPLVGAVIGGVTNSIAIKMLFRPLNPVKIGKYTLPFTPGVIPKEKARIASKIGQVVSKELLNEDVLRKWLMKAEVCEQIENGIDHYLKEYFQSEETFGELLEESVGKERSTYYVCEVEAKVTEKLYSKILSMELGKMVVERIYVAYKDGKFGNAFGPMSFLINESLVESIGAKIEPIITRFIEEEGEEMIRKAIEEESHSLLNTKMNTLSEKIQEYDEVIKKNALKIYDKMITKYLSKILETLDIATIVEERIMAYDALEMEKMILNIMNKELNMIMWFGVLLGAIMGCITSFF